MMRIAAYILMAAMAVSPFAAKASEGAHIEHQTWSFSGLFGTYDRAELQRGYQVYHEVCSSCHSMHLIAFRNLEELGLTEEQVKTIAASVEVQDGPNDDGEMFMRPGRPSDRFPRRFPNDQAARAANNGALPPDMSLITKARAGGADYIYSLLTGYLDTPPAGVTLSDGMHYNTAFPGNQIAMGRPLNDEQITYTDGTKATTAQMARDVSAFLTWASEPELEVRKSMGLKIILFLLVMTCVTYAAKRRLWANVH